jgi:hypothetical protein
LRLLFHRGRISLVIGLAFLAVALLTSELVGRLEPKRYSERAAADSRRRTGDKQESSFREQVEH